MGLFINSGNHPDIYKKNGKIKEHNQESFRLNYFSELVEAQKQVNNSLLGSLNELKLLYKNMDTKQEGQWGEIGGRLAELQKETDRHKQFERTATDWLNQLEKQGHIFQEKMDKGNKQNQDLQIQLKSIGESTELIEEKLMGQDTKNEEIQKQIQELIELNQIMSDQLAKNDDKQNKVLDSMENQEALLEKTIRKVDNLRSVLYERASYLAKKIEDSYQLTSSYLYQILTDSDQSLNFFVTKKNKDENHRKSDE